MKHHIQALYNISKKRKKNILGLMSGTSLDGLDIAFCTFSGAGMKTKVALRHFISIPYEAAFKEQLMAVFAQRNLDFQEVLLLHAEVAEYHASAVLRALRDWNIAPSEVDLLASHGQTLFHAPQRFHGLSDRPNATFQIGDGDHLAVKTGILTLSDFRQKHVAMGGEGAPLALYGDAFLFSKKGRNRFLLNLGGIANFTYLGSGGDYSKAFATDTGPSNTLMDAWARSAFEQAYDKDAVIAMAGRVEPNLLKALLAHPFFEETMPKTTGPELFNFDFLEKALEAIPKGRANPFDVMRTLLECTALSVCNAIQQTSLGASRYRPEVYISGGGADNPLLMKRITELLSAYRVATIAELGIPSAAKEAVLFACLANETICGKSSAERLGVLPMFSMGKISLPH